ncbi:hypothetical protein I4U23_010248 [Adineta vaga]|nr:hypothetical protein I4U23_010248 [Adineta vaga]
MTNVQKNSKINQNNWQSHSSPIPLMSMAIPPTILSRTLPSSCRTSISDPICSSPTAPTSIIMTDNISTISTLINQIDISKYYFAHVIKVPHGTNLLASDNQSTTLCINSMGNIIHLITPTGYHIRSLRWPETTEKVRDIIWCEILQCYLVTTLKSLYTLKYESNQSLEIEKSLDFVVKYSSMNVLVACNSYRLYIYNQSIDIYTLQFVHLHTKQLPIELTNHRMEALTCSDSYLVFHYKHLTNKFIILDSTTMIVKYQFDLLYQTISSLRCLDETILVFIGLRKDGENRLVLFHFNDDDDDDDEIQPMIIEKGVNHENQTIHLLPNCQDVMILNVHTARVQYLKYRS